METLRQLIGSLREERVNNRDLFDDLAWVRMLAVLQTMLCMTFLVVCPTIVLLQLIYWGINESFFPEELSCFLDNKWKLIISWYFRGSKAFNYTNPDVIDAQLKEVALWVLENSIKSLVLGVAAILLLLATNTNTSKYQQIKFCRISMALNFIYFAYEYLQCFTLQYQTTTDGLSLFMCVVYRALFHIKVSDFYAEVKANAPLPPGYKQII